MLRSSSLLQRLAAADRPLARFSVVLLLSWYGVFKFTHAEALAIVDLVQNSPLMSWLYAFLGVDAVAILIGITELLAAVLLLAHYRWPRLGVWGGILSAGIFLTTLSFLLTTPNSFGTVEGLWVPINGSGFILKDLAMLAASLMCLRESLERKHR